MGPKIEEYIRENVQDDGNQNIVLGLLVKDECAGSKVVKPKISVKW
jgi:hypothetical protein